MISVIKIGQVSLGKKKHCVESKIVISLFRKHYWIPVAHLQKKRRRNAKENKIVFSSIKVKANKKLTFVHEQCAIFMALNA